MSTENTATPADFFERAHVGSTKRSLGNRLLNVLCVAVALLTFVPLISIIYLLLQKGLPLLNLEVFRQLPPAAGMTGGGFGNAVVGTFIMVGIALALAAPLG